MEKAIVLYSLDNYSDNISEYERIYFGSEFCQLRLPSDAEVEKLISFAGEKKKKLTLLTPVCSEDDAERIEKIINQYIGELKKYNFEVVVNDWGIFYLLCSYPGVEIVIGRNLMNYKKDPRLATMTDIPEELKYNGARNQLFMEFLASYHVKRVEFDNVAYILEDLQPGTQLSYSVYAPYVSITTTRLCRLQDENLYSAANSLKPYPSCDRKCERYKLRLKNEEIQKEIFVCGNTQYYLSDELLQDWYEQRGIDRIVFDDMGI